MAKKTIKLTSIEAFYIEHNPDKSPEQLALEIKKPADLIRKHLKKIKRQLLQNQQQKMKMTSAKKMAY